jgi:hypothetical protein
MDHPWQSVFYISMRRPRLYFCYRFDASVVNSLTLSIPWGICHSIFIDDFKVCGESVLAADLWISRDIALLTIPYRDHDSIFAMYWMRRSWIHWRCRWILYLSLSIHWPFQGLQLLCVGRRFMDQPWHSVFDNYMRRPWLYFCFPFDVSVVNSLTLSIPCCNCHSVFIDDFKVYGYSLLAGDLWISRDIAFLTIPCVGHDSIFAIYLMLPSWIHWRCRFHAVPVTQYSLTISRSTVTLFLPAIYGSAVT